MNQTICDHCDRVMGERPKKDRLVVRNDSFSVFVDICSFNCLHLWAYEKHLEACAKADFVAEPPEEDIYGPDSGRRDPELLMEEADNRRKAAREG